MKKVSFLMSVLLVCVLFVACKKNNEPAPKLTFTPAAVEIAVGTTSTVKVSGGTAPYTAQEANKAIATAIVDKSDVKITGVKEGQTSIAVTSKNGIKGSIAVKVIAKK